MTRHARLVVLALTAAAAHASPGEPPMKILTLDTGEILRGALVSETDDAIEIAHSVLGTVRLPRARLQSVADAPADGTIPVPKPPEPPPPPPPDSFFKGWTFNLDGGVNGSDGNTETLSARVGAGAARLTPTMETRLDISYTYATDSGEKTKSRGEFNARNDWLSTTSPWGFFALGKVEYDEFQDWDWRLSGFAGPSYTVLKNETTLFRLRAGAGGSYRIGGQDEEFRPEALAGFDFEHAFNDRNKVFATAEWLPRLDDWPEYRVNARAGWEILVDPESKLSLKLGVNNRYDSDPGSGFKKNDIEYFALLSLAF